jgi:hypothetical protein
MSIQFSFKVAGTSFRKKEANAFVKDLATHEVGPTIYLEREPDNEHDTFAIKVMTEDNKHIGYVPSGDCGLAPCICAIVELTELTITCEVLDAKEGKYPRIFVEVTVSP